MSEQEWKKLCVSFQKRHLLAHKMGIIDKRCVETVDCSKSMVGRKVISTEQEVRDFLVSLEKLSQTLFKGFTLA